MTTEIVEFGVTKPLTISLDDEYSEALIRICKAKNHTPEAFCKAWIEFAIRHNCGKYGVNEPASREVTGH
jgi:hypothetical protein